MPLTVSPRSRTNLSKIRSRLSSAIPAPWSRTHTSAWPSRDRQLHLDRLDRRRALLGVVEEVGQHLVEAVGVAVDQHLAVGHLEREGAVGGQGPGGVDRRA